MVLLYMEKGGSVVNWLRFWVQDSKAIPGSNPGLGSNLPPSPQSALHISRAPYGAKSLGDKILTGHGFLIMQKQ